MPSLSHVIEEQISPRMRGELRCTMRLDCYVSESLNLLTRSQIKARKLQAKINGKDVKLSRPVKQGDVLELFWNDSPDANIVPQDIPLDIIYEDERCVVINKAQGMVVHPGAGNRHGTMANALCFRRLNRGGRNLAANVQPGFRPGIVHRLDKETSGVIIAAYDDEAHAFLADQFKARTVKKNYIAIIFGEPEKKTGRIETCISRDPGDRKRFTVSANGKNSLTFYKVLKSWGTHSLVLLRPRTGRTHQLRVHLRHLGHPILGDPVYGYSGKIFPDASLMLHAKSLAITLPGETAERVFSSPLPERFAGVIGRLNKS